jgi:hypothetical protein
MWGNKRAYQLAGDAVENSIEWDAPVHPSDFLPLSRVRLLEGWPVVSFMAWFSRFDGNRVIISMINRNVSNHSCLRSHLGRIGIVESPMSVCS